MILRKKAGFFAVIAALAVLSAGGGLIIKYLSGEGQPPPVLTSPFTDATPSPDVTQAPVVTPTPDAVPSPGPNPSLKFDLDFFIDLDWPETDVHGTERSIFPLTNMYRVYATGVTGPVTFVDAHINTITLPFEPTGYAHVGSGAYALYQAGGWEAILMLPDGTVPRDADGRFIYLYDYYESSFWVVGNTVITCRMDRHPTEDWDIYLLGLYDMEVRREILPCEYWIEVVDSRYFYVSGDGRGRLLDEKGNVIYDFGEVPHTEAMVNDQFRQYYLAEYYINTEARIFYKFPVRYPSLQIIEWNGYYVITAGKTVSFTDRDGNVLYRMNNWGYQDEGDNILYATPDGFVLLDREMTEHFFPAGLSEAFTHNAHLSSYYFDGTEVRYTMQWYTSHSFTYHAVGKDGNVREVPWLEMEYRHWSYRGTPSMIRYEFNHPRRSAFVDADNNIIAESNSGFAVIGDFVVKLEYLHDPEQSERSDPRTVFSPDGTVLLDDILGYVPYGPGGGIFVYLDPDTCVLLTPDGTVIPVPNAPVVEQVYWGG
jgi:hypothetical protein